MIIMRILFLFSLVLLAACQTSRNGTETVQATIRAVTGEVEVRSGNTGWNRARVGENLKEGDEARASGGGQLDVQLAPHGGVFSLKENSTVTVERLGTRADDVNVVAVLRLTQGSILGDTLKLPKGMKVVVKTSGGTFQIP